MRGPEDRDKREVFTLTPFSSLTRYISGKEAFCACALRDIIRREGEKGWIFVSCKFYGNETTAK